MGMLNKTKSASGLQTREDMLRTNSTDKYYREFNFKRKKSIDGDEEENAYKPTKRDILESKYAMRERNENVHRNQNRHMQEIVSSVPINKNTAKILNKRTQATSNTSKSIESYGIIRVFDKDKEDIGYLQDTNMFFTNNKYNAMKINYYNAQQCIKDLKKKYPDYEFEVIRNEVF